MARAVLTVALAGSAGSAQAASFESLVIDHAGGVYSVDAVMLLDAPPAAVRAALTDFAHLDRLSDAIKESRVVRETAAGPLVFTRSRGCIGFICRNLRKTELVEMQGDTITARALPEASNVSKSFTKWTLTATATGTRVHWESAVDPAFFIPPLFGPPLMKAALKREGEALAVGLEREAQLRAIPPQNEPKPEAPDVDG